MYARSRIGFVLVSLLALLVASPTFATAKRDGATGETTVTHRWKNQHGHGMTEVVRDAAGNVVKRKMIHALRDADGKLRNLKSVTELPRAHFRMSTWQSSDRGVSFHASTTARPGTPRVWKRITNLGNGLMRVTTNDDRPGDLPRYSIPVGGDPKWYVSELWRMAVSQKRPLATWVQQHDFVIDPEESFEAMQARLAALE